MVVVAAMVVVVVEDVVAGSVVEVVDVVGEVATAQPPSAIEATATIAGKVLPRTGGFGYPVREL
jgi:hypothetical protein